MSMCANTRTHVICRRFADGFPNLYVRDAIRIRNRHVAFLASFHDPGVIFEQISIIYQLPRLFVGSFTLVLPYFPTGTAERVEAEGDVATAFTLARIISNIPLARGGPASVVIFDIHALQERFYLVIKCCLCSNQAFLSCGSDFVSSLMPKTSPWHILTKALGSGSIISLEIIQKLSVRK